jgi:hypothetical protein
MLTHSDFQRTDRKPTTIKETQNINEMKNSTITRKIIRAAVLGLLALTLPTALVILHAGDKTTAAAAPSQLAKDLIGTWILVGEPGKAGEPPAAGGRLKFLTGRHWTITQADPATGVTIFHHGGTYTLKGNEYLETVQYANESTTNHQGRRRYLHPDWHWQPLDRGLEAREMTRHPSA